MLTIIFLTWEGEGIFHIRKIQLCLTEVEGRVLTLEGQEKAQ